jgi:hypothetical protein
MQDNQLLLALAEPLVTAAKAQNELEVQRMLKNCQEGAALQQQAEEKAGRLRDLFYSLMAQLKEARASCVSTALALAAASRDRDIAARLIYVLHLVPAALYLRLLTCQHQNTKQHLIRHA